MTTTDDREARTNLALVTLAFDIWAIGAKGRSRNSLDKNIALWIEAGRPNHTMINTVVERMRQHVLRLGATPAWVPASVAALLKSPSAATRADALHAGFPSVTAARARGLVAQSEPMPPREQPDTQERRP
jgi:hypothetical protein